MNRNTGASTSRIVSSVAVLTPAATEAIALRGVTRSDTSRRTRSTSTGFTHRTTMSEASTSSAFDAVWRTPSRSARAAARPERRSVTRIRSAIPHAPAGRALADAPLAEAVPLLVLDHAAQAGLRLRSVAGARERVPHHLRVAVHRQHRLRVRLGERADRQPLGLDREADQYWL